MGLVNIDEFVKSQKTPFSVIPAKAGIQSFQALLDSRLRGSDGFRDLLRNHQRCAEEFIQFFLHAGLGHGGS